MSDPADHEHHDDPHHDEPHAHEAHDGPPRVHMDTAEGSIVFELYPDKAPRHVENFQQLIHNGFYDGLTFHRIVPGFIIQAGCPHGDGTGGPGYHLDAEFNDLPHEPGTLSMARTADPHSGGSQFFICLDRENCQHLDGEYTAFGKVVEGMDTVERLADTPLQYPELGAPVDPPMILHCFEVYDDDPTGTPDD